MVLMLVEVVILDFDVGDDAVKMLLDVSDVGLQWRENVQGGRNGGEGVVEEGGDLEEITK